MNDIADKLGEFLKVRGLTIATAESCTAGAIGAAIASIEGASQYFLGSFVTYATDLKTQLLSVNEETINKYGVVSKETAQEMSFGLLNTIRADIAISITGYIGKQGGDVHAENGTVWICVNVRNRKPILKKLMLTNDRAINSNEAVREALELAMVSFENYDEAIDN